MLKVNLLIFIVIYYTLSMLSNGNNFVKSFRPVSNEIPRFKNNSTNRIKLNFNFIEKLPENLNVVDSFIILNSGWEIYKFDFQGNLVSRVKLHRNKYDPSCDLILDLIVKKQNGASLVYITSDCDSIRVFNEQGFVINSYKGAGTTIVSDEDRNIFLISPYYKVNSTFKSLVKISKDGTISGLKAKYDIDAEQLYLSDGKSVFFHDGDKNIIYNIDYSGKEIKIKSQIKVDDRVIGVFSKIIALKDSVFYIKTVDESTFKQTLITKVKNGKVLNIDTLNLKFDELTNKEKEEALNDFSHRNTSRTYFASDSKHIYAMRNTKMGVIISKYKMD